MPLSKDLCQQCWKERMERAFPDDSPSGWNEDDDQHWDAGFVVCPNGEYTMTREVPGKCVFALEHAMLEGDGIARR